MLYKFRICVFVQNRYLVVVLGVRLLCPPSMSRIQYTVSLSFNYNLS